MGLEQGLVPLADVLRHIAAVNLGAAEAERVPSRDVLRNVARRVRRARPTVVQVPVKHPPASAVAATRPFISGKVELLMMGAPFESW